MIQTSAEYFAISEKHVAASKRPAHRDCTAAAWATLDAALSPRAARLKGRGQTPAQRVAARRELNEIHKARRAFLALGHNHYPAREAALVKWRELPEALRPFYEVCRQFDLYL